MSLDVKLINHKPLIKHSTGIFVRENGSIKELSYEEARIQFPNAEINVHQEVTYDVFDGNITHNLTKMAEFLGVYETLWRPHEIGIYYANEIINNLREGIHKMKLMPETYKAYNPENGWGTYEQLLKFMEDYLDACYKYPQAKIDVSI